MAIDLEFRKELFGIVLLAVMQCCLFLPGSAAVRLSVNGKTDIKAGSELYLHCLRSGRPTSNIQWNLNNVEFTDAKIFPNGTLYKKKATLSYRGIWTCQYKGDANSKSPYFLLVVSSPPEVVGVTVTPGRNVSVGTLVKVACQGSGMPLPLIWKWYQNDQQLFRMYNGDRVRDDSFQISLILNRTSKIVCHLSNVNGASQKEVTVSVYNGVPLPEPPPKPTPVPTTTSRPSSLRCLTYPGGVCSPWLVSGHRWAYDLKVEPAKSALGREAAVRQVLAALDKARLSSDLERSQTCARGMKALICGHSFPVCPRPGDLTQDRLRPGPLCWEHCEAVQLLFCAGIPLTKVWRALRDQDVSSATLQLLLPDPDQPMCKGLPHALAPRATGTVETRGKNSQPHCTRVDFEPEWRKPDEVTLRTKNRCFVKKGQLYNGTVHQARLSIRSETLLECAWWNDTKVASVLLRKGYSTVAFPSLRTAGRTCRNPAGLQKRPFCVPENPTKRRETPIVPCNLLSCREWGDKQQREKPANSIYILGYPVAKQRLFLSIAIIVILFVLLIFIVSYCIYCYCNPGMKRPSDRTNVVATNASDYGFGSSIGASIASEFDGSEMKSLLLTPNQDYHGKALAEFISPKLQKLEYPRTEIQDIAELGQGAFGEVFLVAAPKLGYDESQQPIRAAMKVLKNEAPPEMQIQFLKEAKLLADLNNSNIIKLVGIS